MPCRSMFTPIAAASMAWVGHVAAGSSGCGCVELGLHLGRLIRRAVATTVRGSWWSLLRHAYRPVEMEERPASPLATILNYRSNTAELGSPAKNLMGVFFVFHPGYRGVPALKARDSASYGLAKSHSSGSRLETPRQHGPQFRLATLHRRARAGAVQKVSGRCHPGTKSASAARSECPRTPTRESATMSTTSPPSVGAAIFNRRALLGSSNGPEPSRRSGATFAGLPPMHVASWAGE